MLTPEILQIEITDNCNLRCEYCDFPLERDKGIMKYEDIISIINQNPDAKIVCPQFWGEPTLHPDFIKILQYIKLKNKKVNYFTNGILLNKFNIKELLVNTDQIKISIDVFEREKYLEICKVDAFNRVLENVKELWRYKKSHKLKVKIIIRATKITDSKEYWEIFTKFWKDYCDEIEIKTLRHKDLNPEINLKPLEKCERINSHCIIKRTGEMVLCPTDYNGNLKLKNVFEVGVLEAFNCTRINNLRNGKEQNDLCSNCWYRY